MEGGAEQHLGEVERQTKTKDTIRHDLAQKRKANKKVAKERGMGGGVVDSETWVAEIDM